MTDKSRAIQKADKAFSLYIRARDPKCVTCGGETTDCSHVFRRTHLATRWDENNAAGQCRSCHFYHHTQTEAALLNFARKRLGQKKYEDLMNRWGALSNWKTYQIEEIARYYTEKRKVLTNGDGSV